jgi:hypothetical protein
MYIKLFLKKKDLKLSKFYLHLNKISKLLIIHCSDKKDINYWAKVIKRISGNIKRGKLY